MRNFIKKHGNRKYLVFKGNEGEVTDRVAAGMLEYNNICGMLPFTVLTFDDDCSVRYDITGFITVSELMNSTVCRDDIVTVTETVVSAAESAEDYLISSGSVIFNPEYMFWDIAERKLHLCVVPFTGGSFENKTASEFLRDFICRIKFDSNENCDYIGKILGILNSGGEVTSDIIRKLSRDLKTESDNISAPVPEETDEHELHTEIKTSCIENELSVSDSSSVSECFDLLSDYADVDEEIPENRSIFSRLFRDGFIRNRNSAGKCDDSVMPDFNESTGEFLIPDETAETVVINRKKEKSPGLLRLSSNERINIKGKRFRIGSDKRSVDYCIDDNSAVSRVHAEIIRKNDSYFIVDNHSTNHTYVDNREIKSRKEFRLTGNEKIVLADEEFLFCI